MHPLGALAREDEHASLDRLIVTALPPLTPQGQHVVALLIENRHARLAADEVARLAGFQNRHGLARLLEAEGVPPYSQVIHWALILEWTLAWETGHTPLTRHASADDRWARSLRRIVKVRTGLTWSEVRTLGSMWVAAQLAEWCTPRRLPAAPQIHSNPSRPLQPQPPSLRPLPLSLKAG